MLSRMNGVGWMDEEGEEDDGVSWSRGGMASKDELAGHPSSSSFRSMLDDDWYVQSIATATQHHHDGMKELAGFAPSNPPDDAVLFQAVDSSSSCSPSSSVFALDPSPIPSFLPQKPCLSSLLGAICSNPFDAGLDLGSDAGLLASLQESPNANPSAGPSTNASDHHGSMVPGSGFGVLSSHNQMGTSNFGSGGQLGRIPPLCENPSFGSLNFSLDGCVNGGVFLNRPKVLRPLEIFPPLGAQPTLFQKRAALRQNSVVGGSAAPALAVSDVGRRGGEEDRRKTDEDLVDETSMDGSALQYDSDEVADNKLEETMTAETGGEGSGPAAMGRSGSNLNSGTPAGDGGTQKGKKKGLPAKNLMAERRRRKKLNDRLYMLRSVVPKISKMDRASILGDAIEYLKELLQRINDLHNELESTPNSSLPTTPSFHPLTPTPPTLPCRVKEELCPSSLPSPNSQPARVEVRVREGRAVNIHMFCARRPGLLLSTMRALDELGLDIQQAVISCFNGFALDVFRAEQCKEGQDVLPEDIKAVLLHSAGFHGAM